MRNLVCCNIGQRLSTVLHFNFLNNVALCTKDQLNENFTKTSSVLSDTIRSSVTCRIAYTNKLKICLTKVGGISLRLPPKLCNRVAIAASAM